MPDETEKPIKLRITGTETIGHLFEVELTPEEYSEFLRARETGEPKDPDTLVEYWLEASHNDHNERENYWEVERISGKDAPLLVWGYRPDDDADMILPDDGDDDVDNGD